MSDATVSGPTLYELACGFVSERRFPLGFMMRHASDGDLAPLEAWIAKAWAGESSDHESMNVLMDALEPGIYEMYSRSVDVALSYDAAGMGTFRDDEECDRARQWAACRGIVPTIARLLEPAATRVSMGVTP